MKLKIKIGFRDKYTGERYETGDVVEFSDDRAAELLADKRKLVAKTTAKKKKSE